jgi:hypothetical protein
MRLLCLHADRFDYTFDHPTEGADQHHVGEGEAYEEALVVFLAVERADDDKINHAAKEIRHVARLAGVKRIVINPFVHLTSDPAPPAEAHHDAKRLTARLEETFDGEVIFTSFGWYKAFRHRRAWRRCVDVLPARLKPGPDRHTSPRRRVMSVDETTKGAEMNGTSRGEILDEASNWIVGGGIVTMALAPLALPGIALLLVAAIPLVAVGLAGGLLAAIVIGPVMLVRAAVRRMSVWRRPKRVRAEVLRVNPARGG